MPGMQKKQINRYISDRIRWWAYSIKDPKCFQGIFELKNMEEPTEEDKKAISDFQQEVIDATIVTGGCIASMLLGEEVNDLDIYFKNRAIARKVGRYYLNTMSEKLGTTDYVKRVDTHDNERGGIDLYIKSMGVVGDETKGTDGYSYFEHRDPKLVDEFFTAYAKKLGKKETRPKHSVSFLSSNAITLNNDIQIILRFCGDTEQIHDNFDFVHCTNWWSEETGVVYNPEALAAILERRLYYIGSQFPVATIFRFRKFIERGWRVTGGEMLKVAFDVHTLDLTDPRVLRDQCAGMDLAYFNEVIALLDNRAEGEAIDRTYLFRALDKIFKLGDNDVAECQDD